MKNIINIDAPPSSQIPALRRLWQEAFGDTGEFLDAFFSTAFSTNRCRIATENNNVVAALYWFDCKLMDRPVAYIYAVATAASHRGRGICRALMNDTHRHLTTLGYTGTILVPGNEQLFKLYESMGYQTCSYIRSFSCEGSLKSSRENGYADIMIHEIDKHEYAKRRRSMLPIGSVIQENENLDFLETQVSFYAGMDFLLAAHSENNVLYGVELLGNDTAAPSIINALGLSKGHFRTPSGDTPFAMSLPLGKVSSENILKKAYFGLAFD